MLLVIRRRFRGQIYYGRGLFNLWQKSLSFRLGTFLKKFDTSSEPRMVLDVLGFDTRCRIDIKHSNIRLWLPFNDVLSLLTDSNPARYFVIPLHNVADDIVGG